MSAVQIVSVYAYSPKNAPDSADTSLVLQHWELAKPIPGDEAGQTRIAKMIDMGDRLDVYVLGAEGSPLSASGQGLLYTLPSARVALAASVGPVPELLAMIQDAESDDEEEDDESEPAPLPDPAQFAVVGSSAPPSP